MRIVFIFHVKRRFIKTSIVFPPLQSDFSGSLSSKSFFALLPIINVDVIVSVNPLSANITKWSNTLKQFGNSQQIVWLCLNHFVGFVLKG